MKEIIIKALKTFLQAFIGYICAINFTGLDLTDKTAVAGIAMSAVAAGLSALMNIDWHAAEGTAAVLECEYDTLEKALAEPESEDWGEV